jgi:hypothetical protein
VNNSKAIYTVLDLTEDEHDEGGHLRLRNIEGGLVELWLSPSSRKVGKVSAKQLALAAVSLFGNST